MQFTKVPTHPRAAEYNERVERVVNSVVRSIDGLKSFAHVGGRKAAYDDAAFEFIGGASDTMRKKHYDKSLRLLWKAEVESPYLPFRDASRTERALHQGLTAEDRELREHLSSDEFRALLNREYTYEQKQAIVDVLAAIGHGEAYAWLVSCDVLAMVQSTGARAALTMQVLEEAKHFVVLREFLQAFEVPIRRQSGWEYLLLEGVHKADGLEKLFGMNVVVEGIALSLFGMLGHLPGLEVLRLFHLDEARHTALPVNYLAEFPLTRWQKANPVARWRRTRMVLPALPLIFHMEDALATLGIDALEFGGSVVRKIGHLSQRAGFMTPEDSEGLGNFVNVLLNQYGKRTRENHVERNYLLANTTLGEGMLAVETDAFGAAA